MNKTVSAKEVMANIGRSRHYDHRLASIDIKCSQKHVQMLERQSIIPEDTAQMLLSGLEDLRLTLSENPNWEMAPEEEDIHSAIEAELARRVGREADWLATARARNDLAVTTLRIWLREQALAIQHQLTALCRALQKLGHMYSATLMPGFSHLQVAQPVTFGHLCLAWGEMFLRDFKRFAFVHDMLAECPMGAAAMAGSSFNIDRNWVATELGFQQPSANSLDSVGDRGFALDFMNAAASTSLNLSRFSAEIVYLTGSAMELLTLPDELVTTSSALPHKRNPDSAELIRGKCARVVGNQHALQNLVKGLPLSYFRDLQEDKEPLFDTADTLRLCLDAALCLAMEIVPNPEKMREMAARPFVTSGDLAEWLTQHKKIPWRESHHLVNKMVDYARHHHCSLNEIPCDVRGEIDSRLAFSPWPDLDIDTATALRNSEGGSSPERVAQAAEAFRHRLEKLSNLSL
ncbi:argininosuccinate lyase [Pantoea sp. PA1]|uniref:argininosuccinate lyase n=1 Tax=Pantoea ananas TaxID=553 RepID=UPI00034C3112|nr:argininosuccinate lyase [Pantoea ananatis]MDH0055619.1 argininosuccinate lyase [Pantoea ananatis]PQK79139.1 argininosuccinate lyase [Pantoea ananatis]RAR72116.1 argininosuccinate lyase [Pantoea ananatis]SKA70741.1 argininosuccinate lyase [Pantoea ananatis]